MASPIAVTLNAEQEALLISMFKDGKTIPRMAVTIGKSYSWIASYLNRLELEGKIDRSARKKLFAVEPQEQIKRFFNDPASFKSSKSDKIKKHVVFQPRGWPIGIDMTYVPVSLPWISIQHKELPPWQEPEPK